MHLFPTSLKAMISPRKKLQISRESFPAVYHLLFFPVGATISFCLSPDIERHQFDSMWALIYLQIID
jgi:hypothetical protein